jgi:hypothetical protein
MDISGASAATRLARVLGMRLSRCIKPACFRGFEGTFVERNAMPLNAVRAGRLGMRLQRSALAFAGDRTGRGARDLCAETPSEFEARRRSPARGERGASEGLKAWAHPQQQITCLPRRFSSGGGMRSGLHRAHRLRASRRSGVAMLCRPVERWPDRSS